MPKSVGGLLVRTARLPAYIQTLALEVVQHANG